MVWSDEDCAFVAEKCARNGGFGMTILTAFPIRFELD